MMCVVFVFPLVVILKEILKTPSALGRFHGDLGFVGTWVKQAGNASYLCQRFGPDDVLVVSLPLEQFRRNCSARGSIFFGLSWWHYIFVRLHMMYYVILSPSHRDSSSVSLWSISPSWLPVCLLLISCVIVAPCLFPHPLHHQDSLSVSLWSFDLTWL